MISSNSNCGCSTGQTKSSIACPVCRQAGTTVNLTTPQHTVKRSSQSLINPDYRYHFCANPDCDTVYYNEQDDSVIGTHDLKNRVTLKDDSPQTPLCYCFKVLKKQALEEIACTGTTNVFQAIQEKMKPGQSCFCEKANPRGDTCTKDIKEWLETQGISTERNAVSDNDAEGGCCGNPSTTSESNSGCCG